MTGPWEDYQTSAAPAGPWEDFQQAPAQAAQDPRIPTDSFMGPGEEQQAMAALSQQYPVLGKTATAVVHNVQPFIEHPFSSAYNMVVPNAQDYEAIKGLFTGEAYQQRTPIGSQEYYDQVVGNALPLALMGAGMFKGRAAPEVAPAPEAVAPVAAPVQFGTPEGLAYLKEQRALQEYGGTPGAEAPGWAQLRGISASFPRARWPVAGLSASGGSADERR